MSTQCLGFLLFFFFFHPSTTCARCQAPVIAHASPLLQSTLLILLTFIAVPHPCNFCFCRFTVYVVPEHTFVGRKAKPGNAWRGVELIIAQVRVFTSVHLEAYWQRYNVHSSRHGPQNCRIKRQCRTLARLVSQRGQGQSGDVASHRGPLMHSPQPANTT